MEPVLSGHPVLNGRSRGLRLNTGWTVPLKLSTHWAKESSLVSGAITVGSFVWYVLHIMLNACYVPGKKNDVDVPSLEREAGSLLGRGSGFRRSIRFNNRIVFRRFWQRLHNHSHAKIPGVWSHVTCWNSPLFEGIPGENIKSNVPVSS